MPFQKFLDQRLRHTHQRDYGLFLTYRWLAWALAGLVIIAFPDPRLFQVLQLWLLVLTGGITAAFTLGAQHYLGVVQQRPALLALDVIVSMALVWISGGTVLPFLPYAFGALILPALLLPGEGLVGMMLILLSFDQLALALVSIERPTLLEHGLVRLSGGLLCTALLWLLHEGKVLSHFQARNQHKAALASPDPNQAAIGLSSPNATRSAFRTGTTEQSRLHGTADTSIAAPEMAHRIAAPEIQTAPGQENHDLSRVVYHKLPPQPQTDLAGALNQLISDFRGEGKLVLHLSLVGSAQELSLGKRLALLRLAQEALTNIQQHAHAHSASLTVRYEPRAITLTVQDDGVGLLDGTHERPGIHSLRAMAYRLSEFDGNLEVFEGESGGVTVRGMLPLESQ